MILLNSKAARALAVVAIAGAWTVSSAVAQTTSTEKTTHPNVIVVLTDDMGYADISSFTSKPLKVKTPNIDKIAGQGLKLRNFYVSAPICSASRAAILTGMNSPETQITSYLQARKGNANVGQNDYLDPALAFLPKSFKAAGYATAHVGKWHLGGGRDVDNAPSIAQYGYDESWSTWESPQPDPKLGSKVPSWNKNKPKTQLDRSKTTAHMVDLTLDFLKRHAGEPCFITLWPEDLHTPFRPSAEMLKKHGGSENRDRSLENFYGVLENYDHQIGRLAAGLKEQGLEDNTILVFTGDNGPNPDFDGLRSNGLRGKKGTLYEGGVNQPFCIRWPKHIPAGTEDNKTVMCSIDLLPTLTALAGVKVLPEAKGKFDGEDLSRAMLGTPTTRHNPLLFAYGRNRDPHANKRRSSTQLAIRDGDFKLMVNVDGSDVALYNLIKDRGETTNIADQHTSKVKSMKSTVLNWEKSLPKRTHPTP